MKCNVANQADLNIQALALDNLHVQVTTPLPTATQTPTPNSTATQTVPPTPTPEPCVGDCNNDRSVTVDELLTTVNIALGNASVSSCLAGNTAGDGLMTVDEILTAVKNARNGCGSLP